MVTALWFRIGILTYCMEQSPSWEAIWFCSLIKKFSAFYGTRGIKKFSAFYGTRKFITVLTSARHLSLSSANCIQSPQPLPTSWRSILILSPFYVLVSPMVSFHQVSPPKPCAHLSPPLNVPHAPPISFFSILSPAHYWVRSTDH